MNGAEDPRATRALLLIVGVVLGLPAAFLAYWTRNDFNDQLEHTGVFWGCLAAAGVGALMVLVSAIAYAVSLGKAARP